MKAPLPRLLAVGLIAAAGLVLAGCATEPPPTATDAGNATAETPAIERDGKSFDSAQQYVKTQYPGTPGTIFVPTEADYEALDTAIADALCGDDATYAYPCDPTPGVDHAALLVPGIANFDHTFDDTGSVWFTRGYEVYEIAADGTPAGSPTDQISPGGRFDPATGQVTDLR